MHKTCFAYQLQEYDEYGLAFSRFKEYDKKWNINTSVRINIITIVRAVIYAEFNFKISMEFNLLMEKIPVGEIINEIIAVLSNIPTSLNSSFGR